MDDTEHLIGLATEVRKHAHAPYSGFLVGAALRTASGKTFVGCNVENVSLGLTMCAEQCALATAISAGETTLSSIAIVADSALPPMPCGRCRQILAEFNSDLDIITGTINGRSERFRLSDLLPKPKQGILESKQNVSNPE